MKLSKPTFFEKVMRFSFLLAGLSGIFRLYGAITQHPDILNFSGKSWLPAYLIVAGGLMALFNLSIWLVLKRKFILPAWLPWAGVLMNIIAYWLERLLLWAPTQRGTNAPWVIGLHVAWLMLAGISQLQLKRRINEHI
jgi:hypothetical protein